MAWIPRSFSGTKFAIPNLRGDALTVTVRSLADEFGADASGFQTGKEESLYFAFGEGVNHLETQEIPAAESAGKTQVFTGGSDVCRELQPATLSDGQSATHSLNALIDNNINSIWAISEPGFPSTPFRLDISFEESTFLGHYSFTEGIYSHPKAWRLTAGHTLATVEDNTIDQQSGHTWGDGDKEVKTFWVAQDRGKFKFWRFTVTETEFHPDLSTYLVLSGIQLFGCETTQLTESPDSGTSVPSNNIVAVHATTNVTAPPGANARWFATASPSLATLADTWLCTTTQPPWHWSTTAFDTKDPKWAATWNQAVQVGLGEYTVQARLGSSVKITGQHLWSSNTAANEVWCRLDQSKDKLTMTYAADKARKIVAFIPKGEIHTFNLVKEPSDPSWQASYWVLQANTQVAVSALSGNYDARAVPAISRRMVGFVSQFAKFAPYYANTHMNLYYYNQVEGQPDGGNEFADLEKIGEGRYDPMDLKTGFDSEDSDASFTDAKTAYTGGGRHGVLYAADNYREVQYDCRSASHAFANKGFGAGTYIDGDGSDATTWFPIEQLSTEFVMVRQSAFASFVTVRPDHPRGLVRVSVFNPEGELTAVLDNHLKRGEDSGDLDQQTADAKLDLSSIIKSNNFRPSCYKYSPSAGIPAGTRFVMDYPVHMVSIAIVFVVVVVVAIVDVALAAVAVAVVAGAIVVVPPPHLFGWLIISIFIPKNSLFPFPQPLTLWSRCC